MTTKRKKAKTRSEWVCLICFKVARPQPRKVAYAGESTQGTCRRTPKCREMAGPVSCYAKARPKHG